MHPIYRQDLSLSTQPRSSSFGGSTAPTAATAAIFQHSTNQELDDYIIDEILSLEDEQQQLRSTLNCNGTAADERDTQTPSSLTEKLLAMKPMLAPQMQQQRCDMAYSSSGACATTDSRGGSSGNTSYNGSSVTMTSISAAAAISAAGGNGRDHFRQVVSSSAPTSTFDMEAFIRRGSPSGGGSGSGNENEIYRDRRKKDIHNMIERRRRYNINDRIKELGLMLPKSTAEEMKLNKGTILKASCDYIKHLQRDRDIMIRQQQRQYQLEETSRRFMDRIKELEEHMEKHGLHVPPSDLPDLSVTVGSPVYSTNDSPTRGPSFPFDGRAIKQEPLDMEFDSMSGSGVGGGAALLSPTITTTPTSESQPQQQWGSGYMSNQLQEMQIAGSPQSRGSSSRAAMQNALLQQKSPHLTINSSHLLASSLPNGGFGGGMPGQFSPSGMKTEEIGTGGGGGGQHHVLWSPGGNSMLNAAGGQQQSQQMNGFFGCGDAMAIDDIISNNQGPLLQGDPMMGSLTHNQMSPDIQWDMANFSPETTPSGGAGTTNTSTTTTMSPNTCPQQQQQMASLHQNHQFPRQ